MGSFLRASILIVGHSKTRFHLFRAERVKRLGSYVEASVSGTGVHVIVKAHQLASGIAHNGIELYTSGRFFTMTGHTGADARPIIAAPDAFAKLAEELRAQSASSRTGEGDLPTGPLAENGEQAAEAETSAWFGKLPPEKQSEVVKYAALHIAKSTKLFELTGNGGNYQEYLKLALSLARTGVADAEDIFIEAASTAKDADADEALRSFFKNCEDAQPRTNGVTVGTLFYTAIQCGADFSPWKQIARAAAPKLHGSYPVTRRNAVRGLTVLWRPIRGHSRWAIRTGPLVILRVPDKDALPPETRWEGDLPGTTLATPADVMLRAERITWMRKGNKWLLSHPPTARLHWRLSHSDAGPIRGAAFAEHCAGAAHRRRRQHSLHFGLRPANGALSR